MASDPFVSSGSCALQAAGALREGRGVWVLARLAATEADVVGGDTVRGYFLLSNAHDGTQTVRAQFTNIGVVCMNTLNRTELPGCRRRRRDTMVTTAP